MATLTANFFHWAESTNRENDRARCIPITPHKIAGFNIQNKTLVIGNVKQVKDELTQFLKGPCQQILGAAGHESGGVEVGRFAPAVSNLFSEFLSIGHSCLPALAWVVPVTCSLSGHTGGKGPIRIEGTHFGIDPVHGNLLVPLKGIGHKPDFNFPIRTRDFPWVMPECSSLALIPRTYHGNGFLSRRRQYTIASFADSDEHRRFFRDNDLVVAHHDTIVREETGKALHSRHPLICGGRLRPYQADILVGREKPYRAIFDYIAVVIDARSRGLVSISCLSVDFEDWIRFWLDVGEAIWNVVAPNSEKVTPESQENAEFLEQCRRLVIKEIKGWRSVYKGSSDFRPGIEQALDQVMKIAREIPGWPPSDGRQVRDPRRRTVEHLDTLEGFIDHVELDDYLKLAKGFLDVEEIMSKRCAALGFTLPSQ